ncbi:MAG: uracil-DNA glycosylase [Planctomycetota bacterium]
MSPNDNSPEPDPSVALPENVREAALQYLRSMSAAGVAHLPFSNEIEFEFSTAATECEHSPGKVDGNQSVAEMSKTADEVSGSQGSSDPVESASARPPAPSAQRNLISTSSAYGASLDEQARTEKLNVLSSEVAGCQRCPELCANRTNTVFGVGNVAPRIVFFGEGPGADEDRQGEPFVGAAGQLLTKIIGAMKLTREEVYIMNTVKCRPPGNRNPSDSELANCQEFYEQQFDILQPEFIVCLGSVAARKLLETKQSVGRMRGKFFDYRSSRVLVTYHPAYLLRTPQAKRQVWDDMKFLMKAAGIEAS